LVSNKIWQHHLQFICSSASIILLHLIYITIGCTTLRGEPFARHGVFKKSRSILLNGIRTAMECYKKRSVQKTD